ncbi:MAG: hypothetical protein QF898_04900 [SAR202 cluster bacterium]|nr:hypothetical protein [SAR202 cluster bacterium]
MVSEKTKAMLDIERVHNKPIDQIIIDLYEELGAAPLVAERMGITRQTLHNWRHWLGIRLQRKMVAASSSVSEKAS